NLTNVPQISLENEGTQPVYTYAVINDGVNAPVYSVYSNPITPLPELFGYVQTPDESTFLANIRVLLDLNGNGQYDENEPTSTSAADGSYFFNNLTPGKTYSVVALAPDPSFTPDAARTITFTDGQQSQAWFFVTVQPSIRGMVYDDENQNGQFDPDQGE